MPAHPEPEDLLAYAEEPRTSPRAQAVEEHLRTCRECVLHVAALRNLHGLEAEGTLLQNEKPAAEPSEIVKQYLKSKQKGGPSLRAGIGAITGVLGAGWAGLSLVQPGAPAMASGSETSAGHEPAGNLEEPVRSAHTEASDHVEGTHMPPLGNIEPANPIIGTPHEDAQLFPGKQSYADTCAVRCQEYIIRQYTGLDLPEKYYIEEARRNGWYHPGTGTYKQELGNLLEHHNIPVHRYQNANIYNLTAELAQGHKVIVGVNADDLWTNNWLWRDIRQALGFSSMDHAVVVTGIDTQDPEHVKVIISDPGTGEAALKYPIEKFLPAWREAHFFMVATQEPPPAHMHLPEMENFDYRTGHLAHIGAISYDDFQHLAAQDAQHSHEHDADAGHHSAAALLDRIGHGGDADPWDHQASESTHDDPDTTSYHPDDPAGHSQHDDWHQHHTGDSQEDHNADSHHHHTGDDDHSFDGHHDS
ncbi:MAG: C39 family peptidase [Paludibaculum sp.]